MTIAPSRVRVGPVRMGELDGVEPDDVIRGLTASDGLVVLAGQWAGGGVVIAAEPVHTTGPEISLDDVLRAGVRSGDPDVLGGGWFGWLGYPDREGNARHWFGLYPNVLRFRSDERCWYDESVAGLVPDRQLAQRSAQLVELALAAARTAAAGSGPGGYRVGPLTSDTSRAEYCAAVEVCIDHIRAGEIYQANICQQLTGTFDGDPVPLFADLVEQLQPAYAGLVCSGDTTVVSASPELFLARTGRRVASVPIKGTRPCSGPGPDDPGALELRRSSKERAENIMIVDLVRNDLGRVAQTGSVVVPSLLRVEAHCGVWHMVSRVEAELAVTRADDDLLAATFPAGSITGAPKTSARAVIDSLERSPRGVYTGSLGYLTHDRAELNVAIRTLEISGGQLRFGVGAGITASSVPALEWEECRHKVAPLAAVMAADVAMEAPAAPVIRSADLGVFETILVLDGRPVELGAHLDRLRASADELWGQELPAELTSEVLAASAKADSSAVRLRIDVYHAGDGALTWTVAATRTLGPSPMAGQGGLRLPCIAVDEGFGRHKWVDRTLIDSIEDGNRGREVLVVDNDGVCLETTRGSLMLVRGDTLVTPALDGRILPGVTRRAVLDLADQHGVAVEIGSVRMDDIAAADGVAMCNSLVGLSWVRWCAGGLWERPSPLLADLSVALQQRWRRQAAAPREVPRPAQPPQLRSRGGRRVPRVRRKG